MLVHVKQLTSKQLVKKKFLANITAPENDQWLNRIFQIQTFLFAASSNYSKLSDQVQIYNLRRFLFKMTMTNFET